MTKVVISAYSVANKPDIGGHFWVYLQYARGLQQLGCEVVWLEGLRRYDARLNASAIGAFRRRLEHYGFDGEVILYDAAEPIGEDPLPSVGISPSEAEAVLGRADLLLNFHYAIDPAVLARFARTALVDIDPGLLQYWISHDQLFVAPHDLYLTIGETVGTPAARFPDCGLRWLHIRPPICLDLWPYTHDPACRRFTTVSSWMSDDYITEGEGDSQRVLYENNKRVSFLRFAGLPASTASELELALYLAGRADADDRELLAQNGWHVRHSLEVARSPQRYQRYIQTSLGEFSCVKPSCIAFQNAWISDRTLCYLASGKPVVVQDTGPSSFLPDGEGMLRFSTLDEAAAALAAVEAEYERHCRAAREIAETLFDSRLVLSRILDLACARPLTRASASPPAR